MTKGGTPFISSAGRDHVILSKQFMVILGLYRTFSLLALPHALSAALTHWAISSLPLLHTFLVGPAYLRTARLVRLEDLVVWHLSGTGV